ncbi:hypothetical protein BC826DRAFT_1110324 [Russula brevipes]|nr:hypothetical protein BC826DRAFT_1110324 [Russula brevipes]
MASQSLLAALSFLTTNLSDPLFGDALGALQALGHAGFLKLPTPREHGNLVPAYIQLPADPITPVIAYLHIAHNSKYSFLLESILVKIRPNEAVKGDPMHVLEHELSVYKYVKIPQVPTFTGGAIGYIANDALFMLADTLLIYDHLFQTIKVISHVFCPENSTPSNPAFIYQTAVSKVRQ